MDCWTICWWILGDFDMIFGCWKLSSTCVYVFSHFLYVFCYVLLCSILGWIVILFSGGGMNKQPVNNQPCCTRCAVLRSVALCYATFSVVFSVVLCSGVFCCVLLCGMGTAANCSQRSLRVSVYSVMAAETSLKELRSLCNVCENIHKKLCRCFPFSLF